MGAMGNMSSVDSCQTKSLITILSRCVTLEQDRVGSVAFALRKRTCLELTGGPDAESGRLLILLIEKCMIVTGCTCISLTRLGRRVRFA